MCFDEIEFERQRKEKNSNQKFSTLVLFGRLLEFSVELKLCNELSSTVSGSLPMEFHLNMF